MNYRETIDLLERGGLGRVLAVYGEEEYLVNYLLKVVRSSLLGSAEEDMNYIQIQSSGRVEEIIEACETLPFFAERRIVELTGVDLSKEALSKNGPFVEDLIQYIPQLGDHVLLLIRGKGEKFFKGKLYKTIEKQGHVAHCSRLSGQDLKGFIEKRLSRSRIRAKGDLIQYLMDKLGYLGRDSTVNLFDVDNELEKICSATTEGGVLTREAIDQNLISTLRDNIFVLTDAVSIGNTNLAIRTYLRLVQSGEEPFMIFQMLVRQVRNLIHIRLLQARHPKQRDQLESAGLSSFEFQKLSGHLRRIQWQDLLQMHGLLFEMECKTKTSQGDMTTNMLLLITRLSELANSEKPKSQLRRPRVQ